MSAIPSINRSVSVELRYPRPKVMLVDLPDEAVACVRDAGYRVTPASLGTPVKVTPGTKLIPLSPNGRLPNFAEQEVVVVQQRAPEPTDEQPKPPLLAHDERGVWAGTASGTVDSRPYLAQVLNGNAQRIIDHGGVFVIFCAPRFAGSPLVGGRARAGGGLYSDEDLDWTVWDLLPLLSGMHVKYDPGEEVQVKVPDRLDVLQPHLSSATFDCTLEPGSWLANRWMPLAHNKYGSPVAGLVMPDPDDKGSGWVFLLPQVKDPGACVRALLDDVLPWLAPKQFPDSEKALWLHDERYELPGVLRLSGEIADVERMAQERQAELKEDVERERTRDGWMHTLLTGTGDDLAAAVKVALDELGLEDVRLVDDEDEARQTGRRREDLQVWGTSPVMLVEVKGITNLPKEANSLQVTKYLVPRMQAWQRTDVRALSIVNHQRGLPPLARENVHTFQDDVLRNAEEQKFGLLTTFDLFRLLRGKRRWGWADEEVSPLLYGNGRIAPVPLHYEPVGAVDGFFEEAEVVGIRVAASGFKVGDELAFLLPVDHEQERVTSIERDSVAVGRAEPGDHVGIKTSLNKSQARKGVPVYRVRAPGP